MFLIGPEESAFLLRDAKIFRPSDTRKLSLRRLCYGRSALPPGSVFPFEALHPARTVNQFLLPSEEGVAIRTDFEVHHVALIGRAGLERTPARTGDGHFVILGMNVFLHKVRIFSSRFSNGLDKPPVKRQRTPASYKPYSTGAPEKFQPTRFAADQLVGEGIAVQRLPLRSGQRLRVVQAQKQKKAPETLPRKKLPEPLNSQCQPRA